MIKPGTKEWDEWMAENFPPNMGTSVSNETVIDDYPLCEKYAGQWLAYQRRFESGWKRVYGIQEKVTCDVRRIIGSHADTKVLGEHIRVLREKKLIDGVVTMEPCPKKEKTWDKFYILGNIVWYEDRRLIEAILSGENTSQ